MNQHERTPFDRALERARLSAYPPGEFVGQESFMSATEILALAIQAGIGPDVALLDLCCGVGGPGLMITRVLGCRYVGVDSSPAAIEIAKSRAAGLDCRFEVSNIPPVPDGPYDVVLLAETMLAFPRKADLLAEVSGALRPGGRFAFTLEEGDPLSDAERDIMPDADTVWLVPLAAILTSLEETGFTLRSLTDWTEAHAATAKSLLDAYTADGPDIARQIGAQSLEDLLGAHHLWVEWLERGRVRKFAIVAEKTW